jgi:hypothetical protein
MYIPNRFTDRITNLTGQPTTTWGTSVASSASVNTYGSYASVISATAFETYWLEVQVHSIGAAAANGDGLLTLGIDPAGGSSFTDWISHLIVSGAGTAAMGAIIYQFPIFVPAGASIGAKLATARASVTGRVGIRLYGRPSNPDTVWCGTKVETIGANTAASNGTTLTPGTTDEGTVVSLGTLAENAWWWQACVGCSDTTMAGGGLYETLDVGVGTSISVVDWIIQDQKHAALNTSEQTGRTLVPFHQYLWEAPSGLGVYARMQASSTPDSGISAAAYALGG